MIVVLAIVMGFVMAFAVIAADHLKLNLSNVFQIWSMVTLVILLVSAVIPYKSHPSFSVMNTGSKA